MPFRSLSVKPVKRAPFGTIAGDEHFAVECQDALTRFDAVAVGADLFGHAVFVLVKDQQQRTAFLGNDDVPELVECHRNHRTDLFIAQDTLNAKAFLDLESLALIRLLLGDHIDVAIPGNGIAELAEGGRRYPKADR